MAAVVTSRRKLLTSRWFQLQRAKQIHVDYFNSAARFIIAPAGRRSYKTEIAKRKLLRRAIMSRRPNAWFVCAAPVRQQAKDIFWQDLLDFIPSSMRYKESWSELSFRFRHNDARISVVGMDKPDRVEGKILDGIVLDEYGNMKDRVWKENVLPSLSNIGRPGWAIFIGVPEGRNHYYQLYKKAQSDVSGKWAHFHWRSSEVMDKADLDFYASQMDELTFDQEFNANFVHFEGRAYYSFGEEWNVPEEAIPYRQGLDLALGLDFNRKPGVMSIFQENPSRDLTEQVHEVFIPANSNTERVCRTFLNGGPHCTHRAGFKEHPNHVYVYGDATGGAGGSAKVQGSDWDLVKKILKPVFGSRLHFRVPNGNPLERLRVNSLNTRFRAHDGTVRMHVSKVCQKSIEDYEGVTTHEDGSGEIVKEKDSLLTHISDATGYYVVKKHPLAGASASVTMRGASVA